MNKQLILSVAAALLIGTALPAPPAHAQPSSFIVTLTEEGPNVVATGSGTINTTALVLSSHQSNFAGIEPKFALIFTGPTSFPLNTVYAGLSGPTNFGNGSQTLASSGSGMFVGVAGLSGSIYVPRNYVSGRPLMSTLTWDNATFASLGVTPGTYVWKWGSGANAGSFTLRAAVPEPARLGLLVLGQLGGAGFADAGADRWRWPWVSVVEGALINNPLTLGGIVVGPLKAGAQAWRAVRQMRLSDNVAGAIPFPLITHSGTVPFDVLGSTGGVGVPEPAHSGSAY